MAAKIRGITIEIGGDASGLDKALKDINSSIKSTQAQLKDVNKLLKLDPGNAELLAQKQRLLGEATEETAKKLKTLRDAAKAAEQALANGEIGVEQYEALQREIISCEKDLEKLEAQSESTGSKMTDFASKCQSAGETIKQLGEKTRAISAAAAAAVAGLTTMAVKAAQSADDINTLSKQTGLATDTIQKMKYASEKIDVPFETAAAAVRKLKVNLDKQPEVWEKINVSVKNANNEYRNIEDIFNDTIKALSEIENETERDKLAMDLFGKSADELAGYIDDGGAAFRRLSQDAEQKGLLISEEDLQAANDLNDAIDGIKASFMAAFGKSGAKLASAMAPVFEKLGDALGKVAGVIANIPTPLLTIMAGLAIIVAAVSPLLSGLGTLIALLPQIVAGIGMINGALTGLLANPVVLTIAAIVAILAVLGIAIYEVATHWDEISSAASSTMEKVKTTVANSKIGQHFKQDLDEVKSAFNDAGGGIKGAFAAGLSAAKNSFETTFQAMTGLSDSAMSKIESTISSAFQNIVASIKSLPGKFKEAFTNCAQAVIEVFNSLIEKAKTWGKDLADNFTDGLLKMLNKVRGAATKVAQALKDILGFSEPKKGPLSNFHTYAPDMIDLWCKGINDNLYKVKDTANTLAYAMSPQATMGGMQLNQQAQTNSSLASLNQAINGWNPNTTVNVVLEGDARGIFKVVRQENNRLIKATGYHALS